jgi:hypothetical protein
MSKAAYMTRANSWTTLLSEVVETLDVDVEEDVDFETGFSWPSFSVLPGMRNVDSCTLPS